MPYEIQVKTIKKQRFSTLHDSIKPHSYPSDWNKPHNTIFDKNMGGLKQTCGINQPCGQYRTREYIKNAHYSYTAIRCFLHACPRIFLLGAIFGFEV